jgi:thiamine monophosphate synthase
VILFGITGGGPHLAERVRRALESGVDRVVVREDVLPDEILDLAPEWSDRLVLHARMPGADVVAGSLDMGLHLPGGADVAAWRRRFRGPLGYSAHSVEEARAARAAGADHVFLSPIWAPTSKPDDRRPTLGPGVLREVPAVALGGVTVARIAECSGAAGVAVLGGLFGAEDIGAAARAFRAAVDQKLQTSSS